MDSSRANVPDHGDTDRPGSIADRQAEIRVVSPLVLPDLHVVHDLPEPAEDVCGQVLRSAGGGGASGQCLIKLIMAARKRQQRGETHPCSQHLEQRLQVLC
jgi:hypothetical protein